MFCTSADPAQLTRSLLRQILTDPADPDSRTVSVIQSTPPLNPTPAGNVPFATGVIGRNSDPCDVPE
jgi:hypothetical protein